MITPATDRTARPPRSASIAAALSFVWPGLGHWYAGRPRGAALFALPAALIAAVFLIRLAGGVQRFAMSLIEPSVALTVLVLVVLLGAWRLLAIVDASAAVNRRTVFRGRPGQVLAGLTALVVASHGVAALYAWSFYENGSQIFVGGNVDASPSPGAPNATPSLLTIQTPFESQAPRDRRLTILLTGIDKNTARTHSLTDTLLVLTIEPETGEVAMISFPRDIAEFPLYTGGTFKGKINSLMTYAGNHPDQFPDGPMPTLAKELGFLLGIPIPYYAAVDLDGFERMINEVGGVTVDVERAIRDGRYDWLDGSPPGFFLSAGLHTLDGRTALAFVRSRYGAGDNDFTRAARQQLLLLALRTKLTDPAMLPKVPAILDVAGDTIRTNFPPDRIDEMLDLAQSIGVSGVTRIVLQPPGYSVHPPTNTTGGTYILRLHLDAIRQLSVTLFGQDSAYWTDEFDPAGSPIPATPAPSP